jgi:hypothetical protein
LKQFRLLIATKGLQKSGKSLGKQKVWQGNIDLRKEVKLTPTEQEQTFDFSEEIKTFQVNRNLYIEAPREAASQSLR